MFNCEHGNGNRLFFLVSQVELKLGKARVVHQESHVPTLFPLRVGENLCRAGRRVSRWWPVGHIGGIYLFIIR